jgi:excisionase family DNA binding protein
MASAVRASTDPTVDRGSDSCAELPPVLTVDELAALMRVDRKTAYAAIARDEIPGVRRLGRALRVHRDTVLAWLCGQDRASRSRGST